MAKSTPVKTSSEPYVLPRPLATSGASSRRVGNLIRATLSATRSRRVRHHPIGA